VPLEASAGGWLDGGGIHSDRGATASTGMATGRAGGMAASGVPTRSTAKKSSALAATGATGAAGCCARGTHWWDAASQAQTPSSLSKRPWSSVGNPCPSARCHDASSDRGA